MVVALLFIQADMTNLSHAYSFCDVALKFHGGKIGNFGYEMLLQLVSFLKFSVDIKNFGN